MIGFGIYGAIALFGVVAMESSSDHLAGTAHSVICFASNSKLLKYLMPAFLIFV